MCKAILLPSLCLLLASGCTGSKRPDPGPAAVTARAAQAQPVLRRLTAKQYRNTLADLFGDGLVLPPLDEEPATGGFSTTGASQVGTSFQGVEQYLAAADAVARQVLSDETRRYTVVGCVPRAWPPIASAPAGTCASWAGPRSAGRSPTRSTTASSTWR